LQSAHTENVGWINYLPQSTDVDFWANCINSWIEKAVHVVCKRGEKIRVTGIIRSFLQSKCFRYLGNFPS
jgi:hypothetical protein